MQTIYKYNFLIKDAFEIDLPEGAQILKAECQHGQPCLWALVTPGTPSIGVTFHIFGTGHPIRDEMLDRSEHVATFQQGPYVWHLFREK